MNELVERPLTAIEIKQRQVDHLRLLTEIDNYQSEIDEHRRCAKDAANEVARIQSRERELRRELRSGTVWEARQKELGFETADTLLERPKDPAISALTDEPAPEIDPPGPPPPQRHGDGPLLDPVELRHLVTCMRPKQFWPSLKDVEGWHPDVRADVQRWAHAEHAHASPIAGLPLPLRQEMPYVLANYENAPPKPKRGARPLSSGRTRKGAEA